jgi:ketosteroid isomerase-like protein
MEDHESWEPAPNPEDLARFFVLRANAGDVEGLVALYEADAILSTGTSGRVATGSKAIHAFYTELLANWPRFDLGEQRPALRNGNLAFTSTRLVNGTVTAEIARRLPDGTWL